MEWRTGGAAPRAAPAAGAAPGERREAWSPALEQQAEPRRRSGAASLGDSARRLEAGAASRRRPATGAAAAPRQWPPRRLAPLPLAPALVAGRWSPRRLLPRDPRSPVVASASPSPARFRSAILVSAEQWGTGVEGVSWKTWARNGTWGLGLVPGGGPRPGDLRRLRPPLQWSAQQAPRQVGGSSSPFIFSSSIFSDAVTQRRADAGACASQGAKGRRGRRG